MYDLYKAHKKLQLNPVTIYQYQWTLNQPKWKNKSTINNTNIENKTPKGSTLKNQGKNILKTNLKKQVSNFDFLMITIEKNKNKINLKG